MITQLRWRLAAMIAPTPIQAKPNGVTVTFSTAGLIDPHDLGHGIGWSIGR